MLKFSYYIDNVMDKAWFDSSNIVYGECDESDTQFKTVRIVFKNGSTYQYDDVHVADWVSFKNADSQGKSLNEHFKKAGYKYQRIEDADLNALEEELESKLGIDYILNVQDGKMTLIDNKKGIDLYTMDYPGEEIADSIKRMLESLNYIIKIEEHE